MLIYGTLFFCVFFFQNDNVLFTIYQECLLKKEMGQLCFRIDFKVCDNRSEEPDSTFSNMESFTCSENFIKNQFGKA